MAIPGPGTAISINTIVGEFGGTAPHSLSEYYRGGGLVPNTPGNANIPTSGAIPMGGFYGSANRSTVALTITGNTYNYDVYANRGPTYVAGATDLTVTVNPGVTVGSTSTGAYAMLVPSSFNPGDTVTIVNNGVIQGMGGSGGAGANALNRSSGPGGSGGSGGNALYINRPVVVQNNGSLRGGGGGGGGGGSHYAEPKGAVTQSGGGGGGGGAGFNGGAAGSGGAADFSARPGSPGGVGTDTSGGGGGAGGSQPAAFGGPGGSGGGIGAGGSSGGSSSGGSIARPGGAGGPAGFYVVGNPFITWTATGTRQGNVS